MSHAVFSVPTPINEPIRGYAPGSAERTSLQSRIETMLQESYDIPLIIGGEETRTGNTGGMLCPHDHQRSLGQFHQGADGEVEQAINNGMAAWNQWSELAWEDRAAVFLKAADLLAGPWRDTLNAATMLNQSKTVFQAEVDAACELIDFWRFNVHFQRQMMEEQPSSALGMWNRVEYRALEGFVFAATPFNFTSIGGNLPTAPALMGNVVVWKPASTAVLSAYVIMQILKEAGLPPGVINFVPGSGRRIGDPVLASADLAGVHFTGSTAVFQGMWKTIGGNIDRYKTYPRIVGETGGKDFVFAHPSADPQALTVALVRGAFEYQGQKCSAASRAYIPQSLWPEMRERLQAMVGEITIGSPIDFSNFMAAVIDQSSFDNVEGYFASVRNCNDMEFLTGGKGDDEIGYFVPPTVVVSEDPKSRLMCEEIFAPVLTVHVYADDQLNETLEVCNTTSPYALTGAIFARDRRVIVEMSTKLRHAAGNFYINDKPTGAVVGQQPFGGSRASGTNDKAGSAANLMRWTSQRAMKETLVPPTDFRYPHMA